MNPGAGVDSRGDLWHSAGVAASLILCPILRRQAR